MTKELKKIIQEITTLEKVDALFLFWSRKKWNFKKNSDYDIWVIFSEFEKDRFKRKIQAELISMQIEKSKLPKVDLINLEDSWIAIKKTAIESDPIFLRKNRNSIYHVNKVIRAIESQYEKDYLPCYQDKI